MFWVWLRERWWCRVDGKLTIRFKKACRWWKMCFNDDKFTDLSHNNFWFSTPSNFYFPEKKFQKKTHKNFINPFFNKPITFSLALTHFHGYFHLGQLENIFSIFPHNLWPSALEKLFAFIPPCAIFSRENFCASLNYCEGKIVNSLGGRAEAATSVWYAGKGTFSTSVQLFILLHNN